MKKPIFLYKYLFLQIIIIFFAETATAEVLGLAGVNGSEESSYAYIGAIIPINSTLGDEGFRVRMWVDYVEYEYDTILPSSPPLTSGIPASIDGDGFGGNLSIGYQWNIQSTTVSAYAGVALRDRDLSPDDPNSNVEDDDVGARFQLEIYPQLSNNVDVSLIGSYTAVFDSYWIRGRPGYTFTNGLKFGPEVVALGDDDFDKQRYGAFLSGIKLGNINVGINGGYEDGDDGSAYGGVSLSTVF